MEIWKKEKNQTVEEILKGRKHEEWVRYYAKHREEIIKRTTERDRYKDRSAYSKKYYSEHKEEVLKKHKERYDSNAEKMRADARKRYEKNKDAINKRRRELYAMKKEKERLNNAN